MLYLNIKLVPQQAENLLVKTVKALPDAATLEILHERLAEIMVLQQILRIVFFYLNNCLTTCFNSG